MKCRKCKNDIPENSVYCLLCGTKQGVVKQERKPKARGNGQGSVYKMPNGKYRAAVTLGYTEDNKRIYKTKSGFKTRREALEYLPTLKGGASQKETKKITFKALYDKWLPTHKAGTDTINCYKAAMKYFSPIWYLSMKDIDIDDLQECIDECPRGKRTRQNMKAVCGLIYKYGIPRNCIPENLNLATYLIVGGGVTIPKRGFTEEETELIKNACGTVSYADYIYCLIYTGFRLGEFLSLDIKNYNREKHYVIGGFKTEAGTNRFVTISPKIQPIINILAKDKISGPMFCNKETGEAFTPDNFRKDYFYKALEDCGIEKPQERRLTPHSCRRTFGTLMKNVKAADKDKLQLMGHSSEEMLRYYQDVNIEDLKKITDLI